MPRLPFGTRHLTPLAVAIVAALPLTVGTVSAASAPPTSSIGVVNSSGNLGVISNVNQYATVIGGAWSADEGAITSKVPGLGLVYFNGTNLRTSFSTGVTYADASANGWLLQCGPTTCQNPSFSSFGADVGNTSYQAKWISNVKSYLLGHPGIDGIFIDQVLYDPKADFGTYPNKYPDTASWSAAMVSFVKAVHAALRPLGYYIVLNSGTYKAGDPLYNDGTSTVNWFKTLAPYAGGLLNENYDETSQGLRTSAVAWTGYFNKWQTLIGVAQAAGDDFFGLTTSATKNLTYAIYGRASFLLEWDGGGGSFSYGCGGSCDPTDLSWTKNIGTPKSAKVVVGVGYRRNYTGGTVLVNPSPAASQAFTVNGKTYTLSPTTAKILAG